MIRSKRTDENKNEELVLDKLISLVEDLDPELGDEVTECWIYPNSFTLGHLIGHCNSENEWPVEAKDHCLI